MSDNLSKPSSSWDLSNWFALDSLDLDMEVQPLDSSNSPARVMRGPRSSSIGIPPPPPAIPLANLNSNGRVPQQHCSTIICETLLQSPSNVPELFHLQHDQASSHQFENHDSQIANLSPLVDESFYDIFETYQPEQNSNADNVQSSLDPISPNPSPSSSSPSAAQSSGLRGQTSQMPLANNSLLSFDTPRQTTSTAQETFFEPLPSSSTARVLPRKRSHGKQDENPHEDSSQTNQKVKKKKSSKVQSRMDSEQLRPGTYQTKSYNPPRLAGEKGKRGSSKRSTPKVSNRVKPPVRGRKSTSFTANTDSRQNVLVEKNKTCPPRPPRTKNPPPYDVELSSRSLHIDEHSRSRFFLSGSYGDLTVSSEPNSEPVTPQQPLMPSSSIGSPTTPNQYNGRTLPHHLPELNQNSTLQPQCPPSVQYPGETSDHDGIIRIQSIEEASSQFPSLPSVNQALITASFDQPSESIENSTLQSQNPILAQNLNESSEHNGTTTMQDINPSSQRNLSDPPNPVSVRPRRIRRTKIILQLNRQHTLQGLYIIEYPPSWTQLCFVQNNIIVLNNCAHQQPPDILLVLPNNDTQ